jgi:PAS domain S-box-containing protein
VRLAQAWGVTPRQAAVKPFGEIAQLSALGELAPDGMLVADSGGRIMYASSQLGRIFGHRPEDLVGQPVEVLVPERLRSRHEDHRTRYAQHPVGRPMGVGLGLLGRRPDGSEFPVEVSLQPVSGPGGPMVVAFVRDVSEREAAEAAARESEARFRLVLDALEEYAVFMLDASGHVTTWNEGARRVEGYTEDEVMGRHLSFFYLPSDSAAGVPASELDAAAEQGQVTTEGWRMRSDGTRFWASSTTVAIRSDSGSLRGFGRVTRDMTESRLSRGRLEAMVDISSAMLSGAPLAESLGLAVRHARATLGARAAWVELVRSPDGPLEIVAADGLDPDSLLSAGLEPAAPESEPVSTRGSAAGARLLEGLGHLAAVPLDAETVKGSLVVAHQPDGSEFSGAELQVLRLLGSQISVALRVGRHRQERERLNLLEDRERIARDLHDSIIQNLFATGMSLEAAIRIMEPAEARERAEHVVDQLDRVIKEIRSTIFALESPARADASLRDRLRRVVNEAAPNLGFSPDLDLEGPLDSAVPEAIGRQMLATLTEALSNVARHASATKARVEVRVSDDLLLKVKDDGLGIPDGGKLPRRGGNGLRNMAGRAERLGGWMRVQGGASGGTVLEWRVPLREA